MRGRERGASQPIARAKTKAECMHGGNLTGRGVGEWRKANFSLRARVFSWALSEGPRMQKTWYLKKLKRAALEGWAGTTSNTNTNTNFRFAQQRRQQQQQQCQNIFSQSALIVYCQASPSLEQGSLGLSLSEKMVAASASADVLV